MVVEVEPSAERSASKALGNYEVKCVHKDGHNADDTVMEELRAEFASLSTLTNFNRTGAQVCSLTGYPFQYQVVYVGLPSNHTNIILCRLNL